MSEISEGASLEHLREARRHVYDAINEINQSGIGDKLSRYANELREVEDILWQLTTEARRERR